MVTEKHETIDASKALEGLRHIISKAISNGASDIHIEPREEFVWVRYRVATTLQLGTKLPSSSLKGLMSAGKKLASLSLSENSRPQEGEFDISLNNQDHHIHLSIIPVVGGEKMVIHLSPRSSDVISLEGLGYWGANLELIKRTLGHLRGFVVIASSDRNSGSLTLLGIINSVSHPSLKLAAVGDPWINHAQIANHVKVDPRKGLTPERSLRLIIRHDPDVILVTDLNDKDAAKTALEASEKKLVCVSLMAIDNVALLQRLSNMELEAGLLANMTRFAASQTVIRQLCEHCREAYTPPAALRKQLDYLAEDYTPKQLHELEQLAIRSGLGAAINEASTNAKEIIRLWRAHDGGCEHCLYSGFRNYTTLNEVLDTSSRKIQKCLTKSALRRVDIQEAARTAGMIPKHIDGIIKCLRGMVGIDDVLEIAKASGYVQA